MRTTGAMPWPGPTPTIDRVVHHSLIIEFGKDINSVLAEEAARRKGIVLGTGSAAPSAEC